MGGTFGASPDPDAAGFTVTARVADTTTHDGEDGGPAAPVGGAATTETSRTRGRFRGHARRRLVTTIAVPAGIAAA